MIPSRLSATALLMATLSAAMPAAAQNTLNTAPQTEAAPAEGQTDRAPPDAGADTDAIASFVDGNLHFIAYHELGHALVSEFGLPVLGREEDAVDRLATWMMTPTNGEEEPEYLTAAINGWFASASARPLESVAWWGEHGSDEQRAYQIACLLYGWQPSLYKDIADGVELPEERRASCEREAKANDEAWMKMLEPHFRPEGAQRTTGTVTVAYQETSAYKAEQDYLKQLGLLEHVAELLETDYELKPGITVMAAECGQPNAFWSPGQRSLTMCYEIVADFRRMAEAEAQ